MFPEAEGTIQEVEGRFEILNRNGLHARPASQLVELANRFASEISISRDDLEVDGKSILNVMMLAAEQGTVLRVLIRGPDATEAMDALRRLFEDRFGEE